MSSVDKKPDPGALQSAFLELYDIISLLRSPDGCPWDRAQTLETLRPNLIDEAYECIEAIDEKNPAHLREELGDLFLILILMARMSEEAGEWSLEESLREISAKLVRRHPHVFAGEKGASIPDIIRNWDYIKEHVEGKKKKEGVLADVNRALPPLERAYKIQKKVAKVGFDWPAAGPVFAKLAEETRELEEAIEKNDPSLTEDEVGDLLFTVVNIARHVKVDPSLALEKTNRKFMDRFGRVEDDLKAMRVEISQAGLELLDSLWEKAKKNSNQ
ncbi:MAG: nucleoside triphosphate pyrophosphohydrolase [Spirochaetales bacterium]|nr:nucleoside triphosphate pyrophosphohydrolase [Spirochaetales bacterium]